MADASQSPLPTNPLDAGIPVRYVVLHHTGVVPEHFDLMIQMPGGGGGQRLVTWRIVEPPETWAAQAPAAERLADHRLEYLTYEGAISGQRGTVRRVAAGTGDLVGLEDHRVRLFLRELAIHLQLPA